MSLFKIYVPERLCQGYISKLGAPSETAFECNWGEYYCYIQKTFSTNAISIIAHGDSLRVASNFSCKTHRSTSVLAHHVSPPTSCMHIVMCNVYVHTLNSTGLLWRNGNMRRSKINHLIYFRICIRRIWVDAILSFHTHSLNICLQISPSFTLYTIFSQLKVANT